MLTLTLGDWSFIGFIGLIGIIATIVVYRTTESTKDTVISGIITSIICLAMIMGSSWLNTNTTSGARKVKDFQSELNNGLERHLAIFADDGKTIYERIGKFDIEVHENYIVFDENNERTILYRSYTSTLVIEEIGN